MSKAYPQLESAWIWPEKIERFFRKHAEGYTLHVCCGESTVGDVLIDADRDRGPDIQADMRQLPFEQCTFDTVIADPPWKCIQKVGDMHGTFYELLRLVKPTGLVLWNAFGVPSSEQTEREGVWVRQDYEEGKASVIVKYRRYPGQQTL